MNNTQLKHLIRNAGLHMWQVAKHLGISECTFCKWWRDNPISDEKQKRIMEAVEALTAQ